MKRNVFLLLSFLILILIGIGIKYITKNKKIKTQPDTIKIKLPSGEVVDAYKIRFSTRVPVPEKVLIAVKGIVNWETQELSITGKVPPLKNVVLTTETGQKYVLTNPPYVNTLIFNAIGKKVKLKGFTMGKTSFKDYEGLWVEDILEIEK